MPWDVPEEAAPAPAGQIFAAKHSHISFAKEKVVKWLMSTTERSRSWGSHTIRTGLMGKHSLE